jgi:hypothetical protein
MPKGQVAARLSLIPVQLLRAYRRSLSSITSITCYIHHWLLASPAEREGVYALCWICVGVPAGIGAASAVEVRAAVAMPHAVAAAAEVEDPC